jgi:hypothetical protein
MTVIFTIIGMIIVGLIAEYIGYQRGVRDASILQSDEQKEMINHAAQWKKLLEEKEAELQREKKITE